MKLIVLVVLFALSVTPATAKGREQVEFRQYPRRAVCL
jgi:hypothetical protein